MAKPSRRQGASSSGQPQSASSKSSRSSSSKSGGKSRSSDTAVGSSFILLAAFVLLVVFALWSSLPQSSRNSAANTRGPDTEQAPQQQQNQGQQAEQVAKRAVQPGQEPSQEPQHHVNTQSAQGGADEGNTENVPLTEAEKRERQWKPTVLNKLQITSSLEVAGRRIYPEPVKTKLIESRRKTDVKLYTIDHLLTDAECAGLIGAHDRVRQSMVDPIFCFDSENTMRMHLKDHAELKPLLSLGDSDFTEGTTCLNTSTSQKLLKYINYSVSTSFYTGESKFSHEMDRRIEEATGMPAHHGGKYQVTSYGPGVGYKTHTDCIVDSTERRDRFATILVYLNDVPAGGHTIFPDLSISMKPRRARSLVWNSMSPEGVCDKTSVHNASRVETGRKVILQRWYYYHTFEMLGKRYQPPALPARGPDQPIISCDRYDSGSCRMYDEWQYTHIKEYVQQQMSS